MTPCCRIEDFGPTQIRGPVESSKDFLKRLWQNITFQPRNTKPLKMPMRHMDYVNRKGAPIVIKADGLAAGKGVIVAMTLMKPMPY